LSKRNLYSAEVSSRMSAEVLECYLRQHLELAGAQVVFAWHGGEPTLLGTGFFRDVVALQRKHARQGQRVINNLQTNGHSLDEEWCRFLAQERFTVGLSLDGPKEFHDLYRVTKGAKPTQLQAERAFRLLQRHGVHTDVLCVVTDQSVLRPRDVYLFFKELGARYLQFLPLVLRNRDGTASGMSVPPVAYGEFLCAIFDEWVHHDVGRVVIQFIDEAFRPLVGHEHVLCHHRETCGDVLVLEHNGDVYSCDHFVDREHRLGNLCETPLREMLPAERQRSFGLAKRDALPDQCLNCEFLKQCQGGCPKDRFLRTANGDEGLNYLCEGFRHFFGHSRPALDQLSLLWQAGRPIEQIMEMLRAEEQRRPRTIGPNETCPCGSGRKFKKCCGRARVPGEPRGRD
jgi:uncharacterized protein